MTDKMFNIKKFLINALLVIVVTYIIAFVIVGILWDPNGVNLFERPFGKMMMIIGTGLLFSIPLGVGAFIMEHPVVLTIGLGFLACLVVGIMGIKEVTGRRIIYVLLSSITAAGTIQFCLMA